MSVPYSSIHIGAEVDAAVDQALRSTPLWSVTGLTGGGPGNLDGVNCTGIETGTNILVVIGGVVSFYQLQESTEIESSPGLIIPDFPVDETEQRGWQLLGSLEASEVAGALAAALAAQASAAVAEAVSTAAQATANAALPKAGGNMTGQIAEAKGADIASATTTDIGAATGNYVVVTGTTTITGLGTVQAGTRRVVEFSGILTLTHNATSLILPNATSIVTEAGDVATFLSEGSGNWRMTGLLRAAGDTSEFGVYASPGATLNMDGSRYRNFYCSLDQTTTINLVNPIVGRSYLASFASTSAIGPRTVSWHANFVWSAASTEVTIISGVSSPTLYLIHVVTSTKWVIFPHFGWLLLSGGTITGLLTTSHAINESKGTDIASAATTNIGLATGNYVHITGTTTITAFDAIQAGTRRIVEFEGSLTLTHGTAIILPGAANIQTTAGDVAMFVNDDATNWRCVAYLFSGSLPLLRTGGTLSGRLLVPNIEETQSALTYSATPVIDFTGDAVKVITMTGDLTSMTTSNRAAGRKVTVVLDPNGSIRTLTAFNANWRNFSGAALPATLAVGKYFVFTLQATDGNETGVLIAGQTQQ
jgi:hypothetical protein